VGVTHVFDALLDHRLDPLRRAILRVLLASAESKKIAKAREITEARDRYAWLNSVFGVLEGVLDLVGVGGVARGRAFECRATAL
jgi:hypothetical protein